MINLKYFQVVNALAFCLINISCNQYLKHDFQILNNPFLGQDPPGNTPQVFAPGVISSKEYSENGCCFSPNGKEFYFSREVDRTLSIFVTYNLGGKWTIPKVLLTSEGHDFEPYITHDNRRLYYTRSNPSDSTFSSGIWYVERENEKWGEPKFFGKGMYVTSTNRGDLFYSGMLPNGWISGQIVKSKKIDNSFTRPIDLTGPVNSSNYELHPTISPDGSILIFVSRRTEGRNSDEDFNDLYLSFKIESENWTQPIYLGDYLGKSIKMSPYLSPDMKYLFYTSNGDIYWIEANIIEKLKSAHLNKDKLL